MALARSSFAEHYEQLVAREVTHEDMLKDVIRSEVATRTDIMESEWSDFRDMLHVAGVWIGQKKEREKGGGPKLDQFAMVLFEKEREIWFPEEKPRPVMAPSRPCAPKGFPKRAFKALMEEEEELRRWLHGVETRLRENIERACQESYYVLTCFDQMYELEERGRTRIASEENEAVAAIRKKTFMVAPPDFYRQQVIERYGSTYREPTPPKELSFEEFEELKRSEMEQKEFDARCKVFDYLQEMYDAQLFMVHHQEICGRLEIAQEEREDIYPLMQNTCREDFGLRYYFTPSLMHVQPDIIPCMRAMMEDYLVQSELKTLAIVAKIEQSRKEVEERDAERERELAARIKAEEEATEAAEQAKREARAAKLAAKLGTTADAAEEKPQAEEPVEEAAAAAAVEAASPVEAEAATPAADEDAASHRKKVSWDELGAEPSDDEENPKHSYNGNPGAEPEEEAEYAY